jgi:polyferredoxin
MNRKHAIGIGLNLLAGVIAAGSLHLILHAKDYAIFGAYAPDVVRYGTLGFNALLVGLTALVMSRYKSEKGAYIRRYLGVVLFFQVVMLFLLPQYVYPLIQGAPWWLANPYFSTFLVIVFPWLGPFMLMGAGGFLFWYGLAYFALITLLVWLFGRRVYCSWICQRGLLSEVIGDFWRTRTPRGSLSRSAEYLPYFIMVAVFFIAISAALHIYTSFGYEALVGERLGNLNTRMADFADWYKTYFYIVIYQLATLALYPVWGGRIFCRFFCPVGNYLGIVQALGRYRVAGKGYCIHCHECTRNCAMGIDVEAAVNNANKAYRGIQCVGCGVCEYVCPVNNIKLTNNPKKCCPKK